MKAGVCLSVRLSVCLCVTQLLPQFWTEKSLPFWPNHLSILWKQQWVCPSVCLSVCAYIIYFFVFDQISPAKIFMDSLQKGAGFKTFLVKFWRKTKKFDFSPKSSILLFQPSNVRHVCLFVCLSEPYLLPQFWPHLKSKLISWNLLLMPRF